MRRSWLVLAVLVVAAGDAHAKRVSCACPTVVTVPERGAANVPTNAKLWSFGSPGPHRYMTSDGVEIPNVQTEAPFLQPNQPYKNDGWMMDFTTGNGPDEVAPAAPTDIYASITTSAMDAHVDALSISARLPDDAALVRIDLRDTAGITMRLLTTPRRMYLCQPSGFVITPGKVHVEIRALDLAGNQSPPVATEIETTVLPGLDPDLDCRGGG